MAYIVDTTARTRPKNSDQRIKSTEVKREVISEPIDKMKINKSLDTGCINPIIYEFL